MPPIFPNAPKPLSAGPFRILRAALPGSIVFSALLALSLVWGTAVYETNGIACLTESPERLAGSVAAFLLLTALFSACCALAFWKLRSLRDSVRTPKHAAALRESAARAHPVLAPVLCAAVLFICWMPCLLAYWPGIAAYDLYSQTQQAVSGVFTTHHPPLHTFIWACCWNLQEAGGPQATAVYAILQMGCLSLGLACAPAYLARERFPRGFSLAALAFPALNPLVALFAINPTKDVFFAAAFVPLLVCLADIARHPERFADAPARCLPAAALAVLCCLFRNNAVYALALAGLIFLCSPLAKGRRLRAAALLAGTLAAVCIVTGPVFAALGVVTNNARETLSVPAQQIARAVCDGYELTQDEYEALSFYLPVERLTELYNPRFADPVKFELRNTAEDLGGFLKIWADIGLKNPRSYLDAFLALNVPYWYLGASAVDEYSQRIYVETYILLPDGCGFERQSMLPGLLELYESVASFEAFEHIPLVRVLFGLALPFWLMLFAAFATWQTDRRLALLAFGFPLLYWFTFMLGPVSNLRYLFPLIAALPLLVALPFAPPNSRPPSNGHSRQIGVAAKTTFAPRKRRSETSRRSVGSTWHRFPPRLSEKSRFEPFLSVKHQFRRMRRQAGSHFSDRLPRGCPKNSGCSICIPMGM